MDLFYRSLKKRINKKFYYTGVDPYEIFLKKARIAWKNEKNVNFKNGNIYKLPFKRNIMKPVHQCFYSFK